MRACKWKERVWSHFITFFLMTSRISKFDSTTANSIHFFALFLPHPTFGHISSSHATYLFFFYPVLSPLESSPCRRHETQIYWMITLCFPKRQFLKSLSDICLLNQLMPWLLSVRELVATCSA